MAVIGEHCTLEQGDGVLCREGKGGTQEVGMQDEMELMIEQRTGRGSSGRMDSGGVS